jgi:hypothetical protein
VVTLGYFGDALFAGKPCGRKLSCQGVSLFAGKIGPIGGPGTIISCRGRAVSRCENSLRGRNARKGPAFPTGCLR